MNEIKTIKECQNGNKEAFNNLIKFYYPYVFKYLLKLIGNEDITNDIVQDTFLKLIKNIDKYDIKGKSSFSTYLITIAKNCYLDYLRKNKKYVQIIDIDDISDKLTSVENTNINDDLIFDEIDKLPKEQRTAIKLKYLEGYTLREIAKIEQTKPETIKSRIHEGKKKIKKEMKRRKILWIEI